MIQKQADLGGGMEEGKNFVKSWHVTCDSPNALFVGLFSVFTESYLNIRHQRVCII